MSLYLSLTSVYFFLRIDWQSLFYFWTKHNLHTLACFWMNKSGWRGDQILSWCIYSDLFHHWNIQNNNSFYSVHHGLFTRWVGNGHSSCIGIFGVEKIQFFFRIYAAVFLLYRSKQELFDIVWVVSVDYVSKESHVSTVLVIEGLIYL